MTANAHIDDFLGSSKLDEALDFLWAILIDAFTSVKQTTGSAIGYLGKQLNFEHEDYASVTAPKFVNGVLDFYNVTDFADYPHSPDMRVINDLPRLESSKAAMLYSLAYKILYLAKSYRFDMLPK